MGSCWCGALRATHSLLPLWEHGCTVGIDWNPPVLWIVEGMCFFLGHQSHFLGYKNALFGMQKMFLTFSEVKGVSSIVKLLLAFSKVKSGKSAFRPKSGSKSRTNNKPHKQQQVVQTAAQIAPTSSKSNKRSSESSNGSSTNIKNSSKRSTNTKNSNTNSSNTGKKHQKDQQKQQSSKSSTNNSKSSTKRNTSSSKSSTSSSKSCKQYKHQRKQQKQQQRERRGPEGGAPKVSLCSHWRLLVEFRCCLRGFLRYR